ncbi:MAG: sulfotransferase domain-containing protein [Candidatus Nanoarchaeia archaeon]|nr:sulfotransferase domain-containing protein [Candidatus Nanoarchaeia archaeon]
MIVIFAHPRSGSNSLQEILETNPKIKIIREPFNPKSLRDWDPSLESKMNVKDLTTLTSYLRLLSKKYNGIKTLSSQLPTDLNKNLLINPNNKIIFLTRKNLLKAAISKIIGEKTDIWHVDKNTINLYREYLRNFDIGNLDLKKVEENITQFKKDITIYKRMLNENKINFFNIYHEDLFDKSVNERNKIKVIKDLFRFLGYDEKPNFEKIKEILDPKIKNMTYPEIYLKIKNIKEIENRLGNKENGLIFKKSGVSDNFKDNLKKIFSG